ncbi:MAG: InlB B-repeat-containing protein [Candidatus Methanomethylophilaceae archaeon]
MKTNQMAAIFAVIMIALTVVSCAGVISAADSAVTLNVTVDPMTDGVTITAEPVESGYSTVTGTTGANGSVSLILSSGTNWYVYGSAIGDKVSPLRTFDPGNETKWAITLSYVDFVEYTMTYSASGFTSGDAFTYSGDIENYVAATSSSSGSWGTSTLLSICYYQVFDPSTGEILGKLNSSDLTKYTDGTDASSDIKSNNVMFCIPQLWVETTSTSINITNDPTSDGDISAYTQDKWIYEYCAIGVYEGTISNGKLLSISDSTPTASQTRSTFRTAADSVTVTYGDAMVWNYYQWQLYKYAVLFAIEDFDSQGIIGNGNTGGNGPTITGTMNVSGLFAGSTSNSTSGVKAYIENAWGSLNEFVDDVVLNTSLTIYAGTNSTVTDNTSDKTSIVTIPSSGNYPTAISTADNSFGIGTTNGSTSSGGTYDYQTTGSTSQSRLLCVGGSWSNGSNAGVSCVNSGSLSYSGSSFGSRLAYVYDADAASVVTTATVSFNANGGIGGSSVTIDAGETVSAPTTNPTREHYSFTNWYSNAACTTLFDFSSAINSDTTIYAGWQIDTYTVTINTNGGTSNTSAVHDWGTYLSVPTQPTKTGYVFGGWFSDSDLTTKYTFTSIIESDLTIYAKWYDALTFISIPTAALCVTVIDTPTGQTVILDASDSTYAETVTYTINGKTVTTGLYSSIDDLVAGEYTVTATVSNSLGENSISKSFTIDGNEESLFIWGVLALVIVICAVSLYFGFTIPALISGIVAVIIFVIKVIL